MDNLSQVVSPKQRTTWVYFSSFFQVVSPKQWTTWVYLLSLFQVVSPKQWIAWVYLSSCFKWLVLNNGQLEFTFLSFFEWSVPNNGQLVFTCHSLKCHPQYVWSRGVSIKLSFKTNTMIHHHFPQWNYTVPKRSRIPFSTNSGIPLWFLAPVKTSTPSCIHKLHHKHS